jgi:DhnA-type fructose-1,6-bisphosphate aldolase and related enzymes
MDWGMANRMSKLIKADGKCFYLAIDHGYIMGATHGLGKPGNVLAPLTPYIDAVFCTRGVLRSSVDPSIPNAVILRTSGGASVVGKTLSDEAVAVSIDDIIRLNVDSVGVSVFIGTEYEHQTLMALANLINVCEPYGIPVMAVTAVGKELDQRKEARYLTLACRICAEYGAKVVKTYYCDNFEDIVNGCPVPVVIAGGPKTDSVLGVFEFVHDGIKKGAAGVNLGRNIWQDECPTGVARGLQAVIHENATPKDALDLYMSMKAAK